MRLAGLLIGVLLLGCAPLPTGPQGMVEQTSGRAQPTPAHRASILTRTFSYWSALREQRWDDAFAVHTLDYQEDLSFAQWQRAVSRPRPADLRLKVLDWSQGFARYEGPELYAIVEWTAEGGVPALEGMFIWRQEPDGRFLLERFEERLQ